MKLDRVDVHILEELRQDSRLSMRELSKKVNLSAPSVTERVRKMEADGVIQGYTLKIDYKKLDMPISAWVECTVKNGDYQSFLRKIENKPDVEFCYRIAGKACYVTKVNVASLEELELFIHSISSVASTVSHVIFSEVIIQSSLTK